MAGAGKSVVSGYLRELGWNLVYFGGVTLAELDARGLPHTPDNEKAIREELRQKHGKDAYAKCCLPKIQEFLRQGPTVIDGLYSWAEYLFLKKNVTGPMYVWAAYTPRSARYARLAARTVRPLTPEQALARDIAEIENLDKGGPIAMADFTLLNGGSEQGLRKSIDRILRQQVRDSLLTGQSPELLTIIQAAARRKVTRQRIFRMIKEGRLHPDPFARAHGRTLIVRAELDSYKKSKPGAKKFGRLRKHLDSP